VEVDPVGVSSPAQRDSPTTCGRHVDVRRIDLSGTRIRGPRVPDQRSVGVQGPRLDRQRRAESRETHDPKDLVRWISTVASAEWIAEHDRHNSPAAAERVRPRRRTGAAVTERRRRPRRNPSAVELGCSASSRDHRRARGLTNGRSHRSTSCQQPRGRHDRDAAPHPCAGYYCPPGVRTARDRTATIATPRRTGVGVSEPTSRSNGRFNIV
jgi:hypothetical protein